MGKATPAVSQGLRVNPAGRKIAIAPVSKIDQG